jgi:hypothetical protein
MYPINSGSLRRAFFPVFFMLVTAFAAVGQSIERNTVKFNFGMQGILHNTVSAIPLLTDPANATIVDVPVVIHRGDSPKGIFFQQADLLYRRMIGASIGLIGSIGYLWYDAEIEMDPDKRELFYGSGGIQTFPASPVHSFLASTVIGKAGCEWVFRPFASNRMPAFTLSPAFGYIRFLSAKEGYFQDELLYDYNWDQYVKQEVVYYKAGRKMEGIPFVSLAAGFEYTLPSQPAGFYANFEISKFFGGFVPQSETYYRDAEKTVKITYHNSLGLGLKGNIGISTRWGKTSSIGKNLPSGRK